MVIAAGQWFIFIDLRNKTDTDSVETHQHIIQVTADMSCIGEVSPTIVDD